MMGKIDAKLKEWLTLSKRQAWAMFVIAILTQFTIGFNALGCALGLVMGLIVAIAMRDVLNANYRLRRIWK